MFPEVGINRLNLMQGPFSEVENYLCFIGTGTDTNKGKLLTVNTDTKLDEVLGTADSVLKAQVKAAMQNAGQNWNACVFVLDGVLTWDKAADHVMENTKVEGLVLTDPVANAAAVEAVQAKIAAYMAKYRRPIWAVTTARAINPASSGGDTWSAYLTEVKALVNNVRADCVSVVPYLWPDMAGVYAGRLCNKSVTVADSPMRVATGPLVGTFSAKPKDKDGRVLDLSILKELAESRFSVPCWYPDYEGMYWGDGALLDVSGGDYQSIENLRVVQKAMRRVYPLAVARIADRRLNSTPASIAENSAYFMRPLYEMCKSVQILGNTFPGEIEPPQDGDIVIKWPTKYTVELYISVRPYNCPKKITANLLLDLKNYAS